MNAQHVEASAAQRRSDMIRRAADQAEVTNWIITQFFPIGADTEDLTAFTDDQSSGFDEAMLFALEDKIDPAAAAVRCAHDVEERRRISLAVTMPTRWPSATTGRPPICRSNMIWAASSTVSPGLR